MAKIINDSTVEFSRKEREIPEYCWSSIPNIGDIINSRNFEI